MVTSTSLKDAIDIITNLTEIADFKTAIEAGLLANPYFFYSSDENQTFNETAMKASDAAKTAIEKAIGDGTLTKKMFNRQLYSQLIEQLSQRFKTSADDVAPTITPTEQYDIKVKQNQSGSYGRQTDLSLENDTMMVLSAALLDMKTKQILGKDSHVIGSYDSNILGTQGGLFSLWNASEKDFDGPDGQNCIVEIITSGMVEPYPPSDKRAVYSNLLLRGFIDNAFIPILNEVIDLRLSKTQLTYIGEVLKGQYADIYAQILDHAYKGKGWEAAKTFISSFVMFDIKLTLASIKTDGVTSVANLKGFIIPYLVRQFGAAIVKKIGTTLAKKIAVKFIPLFGQVYTALDWGNKGIALGSYVSDSASVPGYVTFEVEWPYKIVAVSPNTAQPENEPLKVLVKGLFSIYKIKLGPFTWKEHYGDIAFERDGDIIFVAIKDKPLITPDGLHFTKVFMPASYRKELEHEDIVDVLYFNYRSGVREIKNEDEYIEIDNELRLDSLDPNEGGGGDTVIIYGSGFSDTLTENIISFAGESSRLGAVCSNVSEESIVSTAPKGVKTGDVIVKVGDQTSNALTFTVNEGEITIRFGDNGNLLDDTFALYVDGKLLYAMSSPATSITYSMTLEPGDHSVKLKGISAPDGVGTYFIRVTGDASLYDSGSDLTAGVTKSYTITVVKSASIVPASAKAPEYKLPPIPPNFFNTRQSERKEN